MEKQRLNREPRKGKDTMKRVNLTEDYSISRVLNGLWQLSQGHSLKGSLDRKEIIAAFHELVENGLTTFDLADIYVGAEDILGEFIQKIHQNSLLTKDSIQIHEKYVPDLTVLETVTFEDTERIIDRSLKKLHRNQIDLLQFHWWDYSIPRYVEVAEHLVKLQEKGKIKHIGVTNFDTPHLKELVDAGIPVLTSQSQYSLFDRRIEKNLLDYCQCEGIHHLCFGTLAGGYLSNKYLNQKDLQPETRSQVKYKQVIVQSFSMSDYQELLQLLDYIAQKHHVSIANVATKYILEQDGVAGAIIGVRNNRHVQSNLRIFDFELEKSDIQAIAEFIGQFENIAGEPYELERTPDSIFRSIIRMNEQKK